MTDQNSTRRDFLKGSAGLVAGAAAATSLLPAGGVFAAGTDETIKVALVGCGGRGSGAAGQALSTKGPVKLVAVADAFEDNARNALNAIKNEYSDKVDVPGDRVFHGFDAYKQAIDSGADLVILATPPGFRPMHFEYAVQKGKHVFMEKPVAVDAPGVRQVLAAAEEAKKKNLKVGVGLQRHHSPRYSDTIKRIQDGAIGDLVLLRVYWNDAGVWVRGRKPGQSEMEYQMRNWYYFNWLCGDHINEQHIHNLDVANWVKNAYPARAQGQGGRQVRTGKDHGEIFDHHFVEYTYPDGTVMLSQCRHQPETWRSVSEHAHGSKGYADISGARMTTRDGKDWKWQGREKDHYQQEHDDLFDAIRNNKAYSEAENGAKSTMTAIMGRMATYSGQELTWDQALNSQIALRPDGYTFDSKPPTTPDAEGRYPIAIPGGKMKIV
jgi:myo-inositol 2-dehydrogenase/D-chiro-inositol 1-dehydrogenase